MNSFCPNFFNHVMNDSYGVYKACCLHVPKIENGELKGITVDQPLSTFWNSDELTSQRLKSISGKFIDGCQGCYNAEKEGGASLRTDLLRTYSKDEKFLERVQKAKNNNGVLDDFPISVEYRVGNLCNLKCRMCNPQDSDLINNEYKEIKSSLSNDASNYLYPTLDTPINIDTSEYCESIKKNVENIKVMRFSGGEPLINKSFYDLIDFFIESGHSKNLDLRINTNLTKLTEDLLNKFKEFKNVNIDFSIDGVEDMYEYIRYPMPWKVINKKIELVSKVIKKEKNISVYANFTVQTYNVLHMLDAIDFFVEKGFVPLLHPVTYPMHLNIKNIPANLKKTITKRINEKISTVNEQYLTLDETKRKWIISKLKSLITLTNLDVEEKSLEDFITFTNTLDQKRNQNFAEIDPYIFSSFLEYKAQTI